MKKLNAIVHNKLLLQAEEAKEQDLVKLASGLESMLNSSPQDEVGNYNFNELQEDVYQELWRVAACVIKYHDLESADAGKIHEVLESFASKLIEEVERSLNVDDTQVGPLETKVPGES
jgi:hypothetical protein